jgi:PEP-CTERM motif
MPCRQRTPRSHSKLFSHAICSSGTLFATTIDSPGEVSRFSFTLALNAGDLIDFDVEPANGGFFLGTGFDATISNGPTAPTPEPATWGLLSLGLMSLAAMLFRLRSCPHIPSVQHFMSF